MTNSSAGDSIEQAGIRFQIGMYEEALHVDPDDAEALRFLAHAYGQIGKGEERLQTDEHLARLTPQDPRVHYNLACSHALLGQTEKAITSLEDACGVGFRDAVLLRRDNELDSLRDDPRFIAIERLIDDDQ